MLNDIFLKNYKLITAKFAQIITSHPIKYFTKKMTTLQRKAHYIRILRKLFIEGKISIELLEELLKLEEPSPN